MKVYSTCLVLLLLELTKDDNTAEGLQRDDEFIPSPFTRALKSPYFVDKTLLLKDFIEGSQKIVITSPKDFGKTINLDMARRFFQITVNSTSGEIINKTTTKMYKLFTDEKLNLQIAQHADFIENHLGEYLVIYLSFSQIQGTNEIEIRDSIRYKVRNLLITYQWLYKSMETKYKDEIYCRHSHDLEKYRKILLHQGNELDTIHGLNVLLQYMQSIYPKKLIALINDYDAPIRYAIERGIHAEEVNKLLLTVVGIFVKMTRYADHTMIVGISRVFRDESIEERLATLDYHYFGCNNSLARYFGFTEHEVDRLFATTDIEKEDKVELKKYFNGYRIPNTTIPLYMSKGIRQYLDTNNIEEDQTISVTVTKIFKCLRHRAFFERLCKVFINSKIQISLNFHLYKDDLATLVHTVRDNCSTYVESGVHFIPFVDNGYLANSTHANYLEIPNKISEEKLQRELEHFYLERYNVNIISSDLAEALVVLLNSDVNTDDGIFQLTDLLAQLLEPAITSHSSLDEFQFQSIIFGAIYCNLRTSEDLRVKRFNTSEEIQFNHIDKLKVTNFDQTTLLIIKVTVQHKLNETIREATQYVPLHAPNMTTIKLVKYLGINLSKKNQVQVGDGDSRKVW